MVVMCVTVSTIMIMMICSVSVTGKVNGDKYISQAKGSITILKSDWPYVDEILLKS